MAIILKPATPVIDIYIDGVTDEEEDRIIVNLTHGTPVVVMVRPREQFLLDNDFVPHDLWEDAAQNYLPFWQFSRKKPKADWLRKGTSWIVEFRVVNPGTRLLQPGEPLELEYYYPARGEGIRATYGGLITDLRLSTRNELQRVRQYT